MADTEPTTAPGADAPHPPDLYGLVSKARAAELRALIETGKREYAAALESRLRAFAAWLAEFRATYPLVCDETTGMPQPCLMHHGAHLEWVNQLARLGRDWARLTAAHRTADADLRGRLLRQQQALTMPADSPRDSTGLMSIGEILALMPDGQPDTDPGPPGVESPGDADPANPAHLLVVPMAGAR